MEQNMRKFSREVALLDKKMNAINPSFRIFRFFSDLNIANLNIPYISEFLTIVLFIIYDIVIISDAIAFGRDNYTEEQKSAIQKFRAIFGPTIGTQPFTFMTSPSFYFRLLVFIFSLLSYYAFIYYHFSLHIGQFWQAYIYVASSCIGPIICWWLVLDITNEFLLYANNPNSTHLTNGILSVIAFPIFTIFHSKSVMDIRFKNQAFTSCDVQRSTRFISGLFVFTVLHELILYSPQYFSFRVVLLIINIFWPLGVAIQTFKYPHFINPVIHTLSIIMPLFGTSSSLLSLVFISINIKNITAQIAAHIVIGSIVCLTAIFFIYHKRKEALHLIKNYDFIKPSEIPLGTFLYVLSVADQDVHQRKFGKDILHEIRQSYPDNLSTVIDMMCFMLILPDNYPEIMNGIVYEAKFDSLNFLNLIRLKSIASVASGEIMYIDGITFLNIQKVKFLFAACYKDVSKLWRGALMYNIAAVRNGMMSYATRVRRYRHFFQASKEHDEVFRKTVTFDIADFDPDDSISEDDINRARKARLFKPKALESMFTKHAVLLAISSIVAIILAAVSFYFSLQNIKYHSRIPDNIYLSQLFVNLIQAFNEYEYCVLFNLSYFLLPSNATREDALSYMFKCVDQIKTLITDTNILEADRFDQYVNQMVDANTIQTTIFDPSSPYSAAIQNMSFSSDYFTECLGNVSDKATSECQNALDVQRSILYLSLIICFALWVIVGALDAITMKHAGKYVDQICWQPMLINKSIVISSFTAYREKYSMIHFGKSTHDDILKPFDLTGTVVLHFLIMPLTSLFIYILYVFSTIETNYLKAGGCFSLITPVMFSCYNYYPSMIADSKNMHTYSLFYKSTSLVTTFISMLSNDEYAYNFITNDVINETYINETEFYYPTIKNTGDQFFLKTLNSTVISILSNRLLSATSRAQEMIVSFNINIPIQLTYSSLEMIMQTNNYLQDFNEEMSAAVSYEGSKCILYKSIGIIVYVAILLIVLYIMYSTIETIREGTYLLMKMLATVPHSPFFAVGGYMDLQPPPKSYSDDLLQVLPSGVIFYNKQNIITKANQVANRMYSNDIVGCDTSAITKIVTDEDGREHHIDIRKYLAHNYPVSFFDQPVHENFYILTDTTNLVNVRNKVKKGNMEIAKHFTLPPALKDARALTMKEVVVVEIIAPESLSDKEFEAFKDFVGEIVYNYPSLFYIDTQRWSCFAVFFMTEKIKTETEAMNFVCKVMKFVENAKMAITIGLSVVQKLTASVANTTTPMIKFNGRQLWKGTFIARDAKPGEVVAEKRLGRLFDDNKFTIISQKKEIFDGQEVEYYVMKAHGQNL